jgi:hypothetical protein
MHEGKRRSERCADACWVISIGILTRMRRYLGSSGSVSAEVSSAERMICLPSIVGSFLAEPRR